MASKSKPNNPKQPTRNETAKLRAEVAKLNAELSQYKQASSKRRRITKAVLKWPLLISAGLLFLVASIVFYVALSLVDTGRFMNLAGPLAEQKSVQQTIAKRTTNSLYDQINLEQLTSEALPPRISFLAPTVARQIRDQTESQAANVLASERAQVIWRTSVGRSHERLIAGLANYDGDGTINLQDVYDNLSSRIKRDKLSFLANKQLPPKYGEIVIIQSQWLEPASFLVSNLSAIRAVTIILFLSLLALAIYVSRRRRTTVIQIGLMISSLSFLLLIAGRVARTILSGNVIPDNQQLFLDVWKVFTTPLVTQLVTAIVFGLALAFVAWISGPSKIAKQIKQRISLVFNGKIHKSLFNKENGLTRFIGRSRKYLLGAIGVGFTLGILVINYSWASLISLIAVCLGLVLLVEILAEDK